MYKEIDNDDDDDDNDDDDDDDDNDSNKDIEDYGSDNRSRDDGDGDNALIAINETQQYTTDFETNRIQATLQKYIRESMWTP